MSKRYKTIAILTPNLNAEEKKSATKLLTETIEKSGGKIAAKEILSDKVLAYKMQSFDRGNYAIFYYRCEQAAAKENFIKVLRKEFAQILKTDRDFLRVDTIEICENKRIAEWEFAVKKLTAR